MKRVLVFLTGFKQAGYQPDQSDLDYLRQEQRLGENLPGYITAGFRRAADNFFHIDITLANANHAYIALVTHMEMLSG